MSKSFTALKEAMRNNEISAFWADKDTFVFQYNAYGEDKDNPEYTVTSEYHSDEDKYVYAKESDYSECDDVLDLTDKHKECIKSLIILITNFLKTGGTSRSAITAICSYHINNGIVMATVEQLTETIRTLNRKLISIYT